MSPFFCLALSGLVKFGLVRSSLAQPSLVWFGPVQLDFGPIRFSLA